MDAPNKRRYRIGPRTLLVVAICAIPLCWVAYHLWWIQQRRDFVSAHQNDYGNKLGPHASIFGPGALIFFNEQAVHSWNAKGMTASEVEDAKRLFPEAEIQGQPNS
jgi:hypothetical protein